LEDRTISHIDKIRLLMLHIIVQEGLQDNERQALFDLVRPTRDEFQAITNLSLLGVRLSASLDKWRTEATKPNPYGLSVLRKGRGRKKDGEEKWENSRYIPVVSHILEV
jgi:syntaxin-binding protein 1